MCIFLIVCRIYLYTPSEKFKDHSEKGIYGDVIEEIDWSVGQINKTLKELDLEENTLVIFTCDNGPWLIFGEHGGSADPLREGKFTTFEGGQRVPCIMKWPAVIPQGSETSENSFNTRFIADNRKNYGF